MEDSAFLGKGWAFPPMFENGGGSLRTVSGEQDIEESLMILFSTRYRERVLHHKFGADFESFLFEDMDSNLYANLRKMIEEAVKIYEPRIVLDRVEFLEEEPMSTTVSIEVEFTIKTTNSRHNLVFPFNMAEGALYQQIVGS